MEKANSNNFSSPYKCVMKIRLHAIYLYLDIFTGLVIASVASVISKPAIFSTTMMLIEVSTHCW